MFIEVNATVPALGETEEISVSGRSVVVAKVGVFNTIEDYPQFSFGSQGSERQRAFEGGIYQNAEGDFDKIILHGSSSAEGTKVYFYITPACLTPSIDPISVSSRLVTFETQEFETIAGGAVFNPPNVDLANSDGDLPTALYIAAIDFDIIYAYGTNPTATNHFRLTAGNDPIKIEGTNLLTDLRFGNQDTGGAADATLSYLREF